MLRSPEHGGHRRSPEFGPSVRSEYDLSTRRDAQERWATSISTPMASWPTSSSTARPENSRIAPQKSYLSRGDQEYRPTGRIAIYLESPTARADLQSDGGD